MTCSNMMKGSDECSSWWQGLVESAKEKSSHAINFVKKDLGEFSTVVVEDTSSMASSMSQKIKAENVNSATQKAGAKVSSLIGGFSKILTTNETEKCERQKLIPTQAFNRVEARLRAIQLDPATYCQPPKSLEFNDWLIEFNIDEKKGTISDVLVTNSQVRALYTQMVPAEVSHSDFWARYFFRLEQLKADEARRVALVERAQEATKETELGWDDEWVDLDENHVFSPEDNSFEPMQCDKPAIDPAPKDQVHAISDSTPSLESSYSLKSTSETPDELSLDRYNHIPCSLTDTRPISSEASNELADKKICFSKEGGATTADKLVDVTSVKDELKEPIETPEKEDGLVTQSKASSESSVTKESTSLDDDWEAEFDVTDVDPKSLEDQPAKTDKDSLEDDWEDWE